jgi:hypothetical protein
MVHMLGLDICWMVEDQDDEMGLTASNYRACTKHISMNGATGDIYNTSIVEIRNNHKHTNLSWSHCCIPVQALPGCSCIQAMNMTRS